MIMLTITFSVEFADGVTRALAARVEEDYSPKEVRLVIRNLLKRLVRTLWEVGVL